MVIHIYINQKISTTFKFSLFNFNLKIKFNLLPNTMKHMPPFYSRTLNAWKGANGNIRMSTGYKNEFEDIENELKELYEEINALKSLMNRLKEASAKKWSKVNALKTRLEIEKSKKRAAKTRELAEIVLNEQEDGDLFKSAGEHLAEEILKNN